MLVSLWCMGSISYRPAPSMRWSGHSYDRACADIRINEATFWPTSYQGYYAYTTSGFPTRFCDEKYTQLWAQENRSNHQPSGFLDVEAADYNRYLCCSMNRAQIKKNTGVPRIEKQITYRCSPSFPEFWKSRILENLAGLAELEKTWLDKFFSSFSSSI